MSEPVESGHSINFRFFGGFFLVVVIPTVHAAGGVFFFGFLLSGKYTWGRTLRTFLPFISNLGLAYEFLFRELQTRPLDWSGQRLPESLFAHFGFSLFH